MDPSSSSKSCFSVGSTGPGAVVLLYAVCAQGSEAGAGLREDPLLSVPGSSGLRPEVQRSGSEIPKGGMR